MNNKIYAIAIIPAKLDSTRLYQKNIQKIKGKSLIEYTIDYALKSKYIKNIIVSTESQEIKNICKNNYKNILVYHRPPHLLGDADTMDVYVDIVQNQFQNYGNNNFSQVATHIVGLQPDHPDRSSNLDDFIDYFERKEYDDLVTVNEIGERNGSVRITKFVHLKNDQVSRKVGSLKDECTNIHTKEDLEKAKLKL